MDHAGFAKSAAGIADAYSGVIDGLVADEDEHSLPTLRTGTLMTDAAGRRRLAREALDHATSLNR
jgi:hypothetical protein